MTQNFDSETHKDLSVTEYHSNTSKMTQLVNFIHSYTKVNLGLVNEGGRVSDEFVGTTRVMKDIL